MQGQALSCRHESVSQRRFPQRHIRSQLSPVTGDQFVNEDEPMALDATTSSPEVMEFAEILRRYALWFCHFCTEPVRPSSALLCNSCGAVICQQHRSGGPGCIVLNTLPLEERGDFKCHLCSDGIRYRVACFGVRTLAKMTWPCTAIVLQLDSLDDNH